MKKFILCLSFCSLVLMGCTSTKDEKKPVILITGGTEAIIVGDTYELPSVFVTDDIDQDIKVNISGDTINPLVAGVYTIYYDAEDKAGNQADQKSYTLTVYDYQTDMDILNGSFETGDLIGWQIESINGQSDAFHADYVIDENNRKDGTYFFDGSETDDDKIGALRSSTFRLGGNGWISFRLGGGNDIETLFLGIYRASDDTLVTKFANSNPQKYGGNEFLVGYKCDLLQIEGMVLGESYYIKIVDQKLENWAIIKIDDIKTFHVIEPSSLTYETVQGQS